MASSLGTARPPAQSGRKATMVGGGIGSLAAAAFMVRDGGIQGRDITVLEALPVLGGSLDATGDAASGYRLRGGRMLTTDNYECTWGLFKTIPSLNTPGQSVYEEIVAFNRLHLPHSRARLVDKHRAKPDVATMGFSLQDRKELLKLTLADETAMGATRITDWLSPPFFETNFWFMWGSSAILVQRGGAVAPYRRDCLMQWPGHGSAAGRILPARTWSASAASAG